MSVYTATENTVTAQDFFSLYVCYIEEYSLGETAQVLSIS